MKRSLTALFVLVLVCLIARPSAYADVKESDWPEASINRSTSVTVTNKKPIRPSLNITQPELQVKTPTNLLDSFSWGKPKAAKKSRKRTARRKARSRNLNRNTDSKRTKKKLNAERIELENWWNKTGNPAVFSFRDCLNQHASQLRELAGPVDPQVHISKAMDETCRIEFDFMANTIAERFGEEGFQKLSSELIRTTFVPALKVAQ